ASASDPIFEGTPDPFYAVSVHRERAPTLPDICELLAYTDKCPHAFKVKDAPFWAFQFHPEVDKAILIQRLGQFKDQYTQDDEHFKEITENANETPFSNALVAKFIDLFDENKQRI
ncbi:MAG: type 1 glutamine amidotransferase, partial [Pseudomonadota bacterium]